MSDTEYVDDMSDDDGSQCGSWSEFAVGEDMPVVEDSELSANEGEEGGAGPLARAGGSVVNCIGTIAENLSFCGQLTHFYKKKKDGFVKRDLFIPVSQDITRAAYIEHVSNVCQKVFTNRDDRSHHVNIAKDYVTKTCDRNAPRNDEIYNQCDKIQPFGSSYDNQNFPPTKYAHGGHSYTTRIFNHLIKLYKMMALVEEAAEEYGVSRKRLMTQVLQTSGHFTPADVDSHASLCYANSKEQVLEWGRQAVIKAHIGFIHKSTKTAIFVCGIMMMSEALFDSKVVKYDLKSIVHLAMCYDNLCNWFMAIEGVCCNPSFNAVLQTTTTGQDQRNRDLNALLRQDHIPDYFVKQIINFSKMVNMQRDSHKHVYELNIKMFTRWNSHIGEFGFQPHDFKVKEKRSDGEPYAKRRRLLTNTDAQSS